MGKIVGTLESLAKELASIKWLRQHQLKKDCMTCECWPALRPMSSAPRDGTPILASFPGNNYASGDFGRNDVRVIRWSGWGGGVWDNDSGYHLGIDEEPVGWRPLPPRELGHWKYELNAEDKTKFSTKTWVKE